MNASKSSKIVKTLATVLAAMSLTTFANDNRAPETLNDLLVDQKVHAVQFQASSMGVQIYRWNGTLWVFVGLPWHF